MKKKLQHRKMKRKTEKKKKFLRKRKHKTLPSRACHVEWFYVHIHEYEIDKQNQYDPIQFLLNFVLIKLEF